jgi:arylsulfatase A-like enzyme
MNTGIDFMLWQGEDFHPLSPEVTTIAEVLQTNGYRTVGLTANPMIGERPGFDLDFYQGFETWETIKDENMSTLGPQWMEELADEKFFFYVHLMGPHHPNFRYEGMNERRGSDYPVSLGHLNEDGLFKDWNLGNVVVEEQLFSYIRTLYADNLWYADHHYVGQLLDEIESRGLTDKTLVIFSSDHGESLGDSMEVNAKATKHKPYWGHSHVTLVEETLHVPLMMSGPGIPAGVQDQESVVELVDLAPTITDYLGIEQQEEWGWDGEPILGERAVKGTSAIADRGSGNSGRSGIRGSELSLTWHQGRKEYLYFDLRSDDPSLPREFVERRDGHAFLEARLQAYFDSQHPPGETERIEGPQGELLDELKALGYME